MSVIEMLIERGYVLTTYVGQWPDGRRAEASYFGKPPLLVVLRELRTRAKARGNPTILITSESSQ